MKIMVVSKDLCLQKYTDVHEMTCNKKKLLCKPNLREMHMHSALMSM